jgi:anti-anti-sigma factor
MRHTFVSLLSSAGMPLEDIDVLAGHKGTVTTETVYRKVIVPELRRGARRDGIQILHPPQELDLTTAGCLATRGHAAITGHARLLLLDLTGLSFCDARGLSALVKIANHADKTGCRYGLIAPQPPVAKVLRITRLDQRLSIFATIDDALAHFAPMASASAQ